MSTGIRVAIVVLVLTTLSAAPSVWWERPSAVQPSNTRHLHVDGVIGDDSAGCGDSAVWASGLWPCRSIQSAIDRIEPFLAEDVVIHINQGGYAGGLVIADRASPNMSRIILRGEPSAVVSGAGQLETGIRIWRTTGVVLENLTIRDFTGDGLLAGLDSTVSIADSTILANGGHGLFVAQSAARLENVELHRNTLTAISCEDGWLSLASPGKGISIHDNGGAAVFAGGCRATLDGPAVVTRNHGGLIAVHGGEINLNMRTDVSVEDNGGTEFMADCHGVIAGYRHVAGAIADCEQLNMGVCMPDAAIGVPSGGRPGRDIHYTQEPGRLR